MNPRANQRHWPCQPDWEVEVDNLGGGIGKRVVTRPPVTADDGAAIPEQIDDYYLDGTSAKTTGNLGPSRISRYAANATGLVTESAYLDGATEKETTFSQNDWAGRQVRMTSLGSVRASRQNQLDAGTAMEKKRSWQGR